MADFSKPVTTDTYANVLAYLKAVTSDLALGLDPATTTPTNIPTNAIRWNSASNKWQKYNGTTWADLSSSFTFSSVTLSGGTANGVAYLNGSGVVTTVTGLMFDGSTLFIGSGGASTTTVATTRVGFTNSTNINSFDVGLLGGASDATGYIYQRAAASLVFGTSNAEKMRLDASGNLGIGTNSPGYKLDVNGVIYNNAAVFVSKGVQGNASGFTFSGVGTNYGRIYEAANDRWALGYAASYAGASTEVLNWNSSGNLGLGVTPSAWGAAYKAIQNTAFVSLYSVNNATGGISNNAYNNGTSWIYLGTAGAGLYNQSLGIHQWHTAPSGTAGSAITFTQAMTLDAAGNLGVGTATPGAKLDVADGSGGAPSIRLTNTAAGAWVRYVNTGSSNTLIDSNVGFQFRVGASYTTAATIDTSGNLIANTSVTGYWQLPSGTTAQRPTGAAGMIRFNNSLAKYEGHNGSAWSSIGGGATGGGSDDIFHENGQTVTTDYTITSGKNAMSAGPITVNTGITVTVPTGSTWVIV